MIRYCLKPRTKAAIEREAARLVPSDSTLTRFERHGAVRGKDVMTPRWARDYLKLPCIKGMTPAQSSRDLAAHLKRWKEEREWSKAPGACDLQPMGNRGDWT